MTKNNRHIEYLRQPASEFLASVRDVIPAKWRRARAGIGPIFWFLLLPLIMTAGFFAAVLVGYLSGVLNGEGVIDHRNTLARKTAMEMEARIRQARFKSRNAPDKKLEKDGQ